TLLDLKSVYNNFNIMGLVTVHLHSLYNILDLPIYPYFNESLFGNLFKKLPIMPFSGSYDGGQDIYFFALVGRYDQFLYLGIAIADHFFPGIITIGITGPGIEKPKEIVDFRNGAHCGPW